jgi:hypothetical protein
MFAATIRTAEPPTLSDQAGVRVLDARIAGDRTALRKKNNRDKGTPTTSLIPQPGRHSQSSGHNVGRGSHDFFKSKTIAAHASST